MGQVATGVLAAYRVVALATHQAAARRIRWRPGRRWGFAGVAHRPRLPGRGHAGAGAVRGGRGWQTGDPWYQLLARRWAKTLGVLFAVGAVYAWMNDLRGFTITRGRLTGVDPWAAMFNRATLQATTISAGVGIVLLVPSLAWLFRLFQHEQRS